MSTNEPPILATEDPELTADEEFTFDGSRPRSAAAVMLGTSVVGEVVAALTEALIVIDAEGNVVLVNPAARALLGREVTDLPVREWTSDVGLSRPDGSEVPVQSLPVLRALQGQTVTSELMRVCSADSHAGRIVECNAAPILSDGGVIAAVMTFHDVTERTRRESDLESFATIASHDLQQPIRLIRQLTSRMMAEVRSVEVSPELDARLDRYSQLIDDYGERAHNLVEALLRFSRSGQVGVSRDVPLKPLTEALVERAQKVWPRATFEVSVTRTAVAYCDASALEIALTNLISNACRYVAPGTSPTVFIESALSRSAVEIIVSDNGIGIAEEHFESIWKPLFRLHAHTEYPGSGIGLSVTRRLIEAPGGAVSLESTPGKGSTFRVKLRRLEALATRPDLSCVSHMLNEEDRSR